MTRGARLGRDAEVVVVTVLLRVVYDRPLGILGDRGVDGLELNLALDENPGP